MNAYLAMVQMLKQLLQEMDTVMPMGSGYYTCVPFARRFNKMLGQAKNLIGEENPVIQTFDILDESDPKDPSAKSKRLLEVRVEVGQLIALLNSMAEEQKASS